MQCCACVQHYDVPSVSLRAAVWPLLRDNVDGFRVGAALLLLVRCTTTRLGLPTKCHHSTYPQQLCQLTPELLAAGCSQQVDKVLQAGQRRADKTPLEVPDKDSQSLYFYNDV